MDCTCGSFLRRNAERGEQQQQHGGGAASVMMDASFVHLPPSLQVQDDLQSATEKMEQHRINPLHVEFLENVASQTASSRLCLLCVHRIETAMEMDIQRLESECRLYRNASQDEKTRQASQLRTIQSSYSDGSTPHLDDHALEIMQHNLRQELARLGQICKEEESELKNLTNLFQDAMAVSKHLDDLQWSMNEEANALELETHAFENEEQQIMTSLIEVQSEVDRLSSKGIRFPTRALDLRVDSARGLRYPLINELRLAYRPKGDVEWGEIQSAWALAAQLLLQSATLLDFQSRHWRIVPLSQCAKIIYHPPGGEKRGSVYNIGHESSKCNEALIAWNALLCEVVQHASRTIQASVEKGLVDPQTVEKLPFEQTSQKIGGVPLRHLDVNDDASWSRVVHFMSCNLLWLANVASLWTLEDVVLSAVDL
mmetsp:Transcript_8302/g.16674  ORF Transcript_8302/g.16674 Transcript_8302/m.16674 type:complete len:427 (+) Transcript_8302:63-1343(+)